VATRLYLNYIPQGTNKAPGPRPVLHNSWNQTQAGMSDGYAWMLPEPTTDAYGAYQTALTTHAGQTSSLAGNNVECLCWISPTMVAGINFTSGVSTFTCQIQGMESAVNDNIINRVRTLRVFDRDCTQVQVTLILFGNATSVVEWNTSLRNLTFLGATAVGASYTTVVGDRLVLELGYKDSSGASITGTSRSGQTGSTGDLGTNETDTTTTLRPWLESSVDLTFTKSDPPPRAMTRRLLLPNRDFDPWSVSGWAS